MSKWVKMAIVSALLLCVAMIYIGKNVLYKVEPGNGDKQISSGSKTEQQSEQNSQQTNTALPMLLELKTST